MSLSLAFVLAATVAVPHHDGDVIRLDGRADGLRPALRHVPPVKRSANKDKVVLFVHGSTFPSALSFAYPLDGHSWMDDLAAAGFDTWALDFLGYGEADRYPEMREAADAHPPLGRARESATQIELAIKTILRRTGGTAVSIVAHSWGTVPAGMVAAEHPEIVNRLVLYGPIGRRQEETAGVTGAFALITPEQQWQAFGFGVPPGRPLPFDRPTFDAWVAAYLRSDITSTERSAPSVKVPNGPFADDADALGGNLPYDPAALRVPVLIARGEWDAVTSDDDVRQLYAAITAAPVKRMVWINGATHRMHLERNRHQLYREVQTFLEANDR